MQLKKIILYNSKGEKRILEFNIGKVNIITGKSRTGKSALIKIIDYCLGRSDFSIPGVIKDTVAWYALILDLNDKEIFIAKPKPVASYNSQKKVFLKIDSKIEIPDMSELVPNTNDDALIVFLGNEIGIKPNRNKEYSLQDPLEANFNHAKLFLFLAQNVIADQDILFHRQSEEMMARTIRLTLPYFLGAIKENQLKLEYELIQSKRELRKLERKVKESELIAGRTLSQALLLYEEAKQVGLQISSDIRTDNVDFIIAQLRKIVDSWEPRKVPILPENDQIQQLQKLRKHLIDKKFELNSKLNVLEVELTESDEFVKVSNEQIYRLESISLFEDITSEQCPLCGSKLMNKLPSIGELKKSIEQLNLSLNMVKKEKPNLTKYINEIKKERDEINSEIQNVSEKLKVLINEEQSIKKESDLNERMARVVGRISLFLENYNILTEEQDLYIKIDELKRKISDLEELFDEGHKKEILTSILSRISKDMTAFSESLNLEYIGCPYRLDLSKLTVVADNDESPVPMKRMGSAENWLGCHIISLLSLHKYFVQKNRPVPRFLVLDQPSQVYFPDEKYKKMEGDVNEIKDEDRVAVKRLFDLLFDFCDLLYPNFQIIVTDHANLADSRFQSALVEDPWRNGLSLIPDSWIKS